MITSKPIWIDDSEGHEEGGYWQAETTIRGKKIKIECWKEKPKFDGGFGCELRHVIAEDGLVLISTQPNRTILAIDSRSNTTKNVFKDAFICCSFSTPTTTRTS